MERLKKIGIIYNASRKENLEVVEKLEKFLHGKGISTWRGRTGSEKSDWEFLSESLDFAIVLGGDGTLLGTSRILAPKGISMFGINTGHLGFYPLYSKCNCCKSRKNAQLFALGKAMFGTMALFPCQESGPNKLHW